MQSVLFEEGMEEFTSDGSEQLLHLCGGTIHEPSIPGFSTAVNTRVKIGARGLLCLVYYCIRKHGLVSRPLPLTRGETVW